MELNLTLNDEKHNASKVAKNWYSKAVNIINVEDARHIFCNHSYSPHEWDNGERRQASYLKTHFIVADYDSGFTIRKAQERYNEFKYILITSKSHQIVKPKHEDLGKVDRFHIIFPIKDSITNPERIKRLKYAEIFKGSDSTVYETGRFFFPSPASAEVYINEDGKNLNVDALKYVMPFPVQKSLPTKTFDLSTIGTIRKHCKTVDETFTAIETNNAQGSKGHKQRLLTANIIRNTTNDEGYVKKLFSNLSDYDEAITLKHYRSFDSKSITCTKLQEFDWGLCSGTCELMKDIGKHSPIAFKYRSGSSLYTNDKLLKDAKKDSHLAELLKRAKTTYNPLKRQKLIERISIESGLKESVLKQEIKNVQLIDDEKPYVVNGKIQEVKAAEYIIDEFKLIRYQEDFYRYEGGVWNRITKEETEALIHNEIKKWSDNHTISEVLNAVKREGFISQKKVEENSDTYGIACNNGLLDVRDNSFRDFTEGDYRFQKMNAAYDPSARADEFLATLNDLFDGDIDSDDKIKMLQKIMGYLLIPDYTLLKKMFYLWGPKANNGKSTVLDIIQAVMGEAYIDSVPLNRLDGFMLKRLAGVHANIVGDQDAAVKVPDGVIKQLVGGRDRITADVKNKEAINFKNHARLVFAVNKLPFSQAKDAGYYTRVSVLVFNNEFVVNPEGKQKQADPEKIDRIIEDELDGILNWMLEGLQRLLKNRRLTIPVSSIEALDEYKKENNSVLQYVQDNCRIDKDSRIKRTEIYEDYCKWCLQNGYKKNVTANTFYKTVISEFAVRDYRNKDGRFLDGISIINRTMMFKG